MEKILITGSSGLIGSEVAVFFYKQGFTVHGLDNNQRAVFFGPQGDTRWSQRRLEDCLPNFCHHEMDIRDRRGIIDLVKELRPSGIIHTAAQPSHDRAANIPFDDVELPLKDIVRGFSWTVIPITWRNRRSGVAKLKIKEMGSRYLFICLYVWLEKYLSRGDYKKY